MKISKFSQIQIIRILRKRNEEAIITIQLENYKQEKETKFFDLFVQNGELLKIKKTAQLSPYCPNCAKYCVNLSPSYRNLSYILVKANHQVTCLFQ